MSRAAIATLSTENLLHNLSVLKNKAPHAHVIAMVKANAYGHGLRSVGIRLGPYVENLGVASIEEAVALRKVGVKKPITLMEGVFEPEEYLVSSCENFHVVIHEKNQLQWFLLASLPLPLLVWIKVDTGMGRLGFHPEEISQVYDELVKSKNIKFPLGLMSHFACAEESNHPKNQEQMDLFRKILPDPSIRRSFSNSAAIFQFPEAAYDAIRPGLSLYGVSSFPHIKASELGLKPVMTLQTRLISIREMKKGDTIGYGARFQCPNNMRVGVIAMGYGDGYPRTAQDGTPILVNDKRCQVVGRVSMDMTTIDLTCCPEAQVGDPVTLWGEALPIEEVAHFTQQIPYDLLCGIQSRVKFQWTLNA